MGGFVAEAQQAIAANVKLPPGYFVSWGGQFENQQRAMKRLAVIVPMTIGLIYLLLFGSFNSLRQAALIILNVPFALIGGILGLLPLLFSSGAGSEVQRPLAAVVVGGLLTSTALTLLLLPALYGWFEGRQVEY